MAAGSALAACSCFVLALMLDGPAVGAQLASLPPRPTPELTTYAMLERAELHGAGGSAGWAAFWETLSAGQPITAVALGTSVTGTQGGCTHSFMPFCPRCCSTRDLGPGKNAELVSRASRGRGWVRRWFDWLNDTWPHAESALYNAGRAGGSLRLFAECLSSWAPRRVDLWILEMGVVADSELHHIERLIRTLLRHPASPGGAPPAVLFVVLFPWCVWPAHNPLRHPGGLERLCTATTPPHLPLPAALGPFADLRRGRDGPPSPTEEEKAVALARYYHAAAVSAQDLLWHEFATPAGRWPNVSLAAWVTHDGVHPTERAARLYSEWLVDETWRLHAAWASGGRLRVAARRGPPFLPPPVAPELGPHRSLVCYTTDANRLERIRAGAVRKQRAISRADKIRPERRHVIDAEGAIVAHVLESRGWRFIEKEPGSRTVFKPGLEATEVGAVVALQLLPLPPAANRTLPEIRPDDAHRMYIAVRRLVSYGGMGVVRAECARACACEPARISGHHRARTSLTREAVLRFVQADMAAIDSGRDVCALRLTVAAETDAPDGGHRFKLVQVVLGEEGPPPPRWPVLNASVVPSSRPPQAPRP